MLGDSVYLNISGVRCSDDPSIPDHPGRISRVELCGNTLPAPAGDADSFSTSCDTVLDLSDEVTLYRITTDLYTLLMMDLVTAILEIVPKQADGTPIDLTDPADFLTARVDIDPETDGIQELKAWAALVEFLRGLPDTGGTAGLADLPEAIYGEGGAGFGRVTTGG
jgi:hypothetical protein